MEFAAGDDERVGRRIGGGLGGDGVLFGVAQGRIGEVGGVAAVAAPSIAAPGSIECLRRGIGLPRRWVGVLRGLRSAQQR